MQNACLHGARDAHENKRLARNAAFQRVVLFTARSVWGKKEVGSSPPFHRSGPSQIKAVPARTLKRKENTDGLGRTFYFLKLSSLKNAALAGLQRRASPSKALSGKAKI